MIWIQNISTAGTPADTVHPYVLRINNREVARFTHHRPAGLAACLRAAADAVEKQCDLDALTILKLIEEGRG